MKIPHALLALPRLLLATLCALPFLVAPGVPVSIAQQPAAVLSDTPKPQATPTPAVRAATTAPGEARAAAGSRKKTPVVLGSITGRVVGEGGEPLAGVSVNAAPRAYNPAFRTQRTTTADEEGNFRLEGLEPGVYGVYATLAGYVVEADPQTGRQAVAYRPGDTATVRLVKGGIVTGMVTDPQGEPLVAMSVRAHRVRDLDGRAMPSGANYAGEDKTDDRGVYRIYGLQPGVYVVLAGGFSPWSFGPGGSVYDTDSPTFFPSSTRDTASEVTVRAGQEAAGIDVRYREEGGHRVTGRIEAPAPAPDQNTSIGVTLTYASTGINAGNSWVPLSAENPAFSLEAVADGEYDLHASGGGREGLTFASVPQRVTVRGADVTGLVFKLAPLATVSGALVIEPSSETDRAREACKDRRASLAPQETLVALLADRPASAKNLPAGRTSLRETTPEDGGAFALRGLEAGRYRLAVRPLDENLFVRSVQLPGATAPILVAPRASAASSGKRPNVALSGNSSARDALDIKPGQQLSGIAVRLSEGASVLTGRVVAPEGAAPPPFAQLRVHLIPAERERGDDPLRFFETTLAPDGAFTFKSLAPGRYLVLARIAPDANEAAPRPAFWDADSRARLRREAEAAAATVELQPCQRAADFTVRFPATAK